MVGVFITAILVRLLAGGQAMSGSASELPRVGVIGLGIMGRPMALNVLKAGFPLTVSSRSPGPVEELVAAGARRAGDPAEVAAASDVVVLMVPATADVEDVLGGATGLVAGAHEGQIVIVMGTHEPAAVPEWADRVGKAGAELLDAPVSGGEIGAVEGTLSIMVGGPASALERVAPILATMGRRIVHIGGHGAGMVAKACNQLVVASEIEAVAEALTLAKAAGVDPAKVRDALLGGFAASRVLEVHGLRMIERDFVPGGRVSMHEKDARIVLETAREYGVDLPGFRPVEEAFRRLIDQGKGELDHSVLITLLEPEPAS
jgi:2-hydroxy-3-oxopropionate reductase